VLLSIVLTINRGYSAVDKCLKSIIVRNSVCNILVIEVYVHHNQVSRTTTQKEVQKEKLIIVSHTVAHQQSENLNNRQSTVDEY